MSVTVFIHGVGLWLATVTLAVHDFSLRAPDSEANTPRTHEEAVGAGLLSRNSPMDDDVERDDGGVNRPIVLHHAAEYGSLSSATHHAQ